jgi:hypothetical protein
VAQEAAWLIDDWLGRPALVSCAFVQPLLAAPFLVFVSS